MIVALVSFSTAQATLEEVQGVIGLRALRVEVLYHKEDRRESFSYEDLMEELR